MRGTTTKTLVGCGGVWLIAVSVAWGNPRSVSSPPGGTRPGAPTLNVQVSVSVTGELYEATATTTRPAAPSPSAKAPQPEKESQAATPTAKPVVVKAKGFVHYYEQEMAANPRRDPAPLWAGPCLRNYRRAQAQIQVGDETVRADLPSPDTLVLCQIDRPEAQVPTLQLKSLSGPLSRSQYDLLDVPMPTPFIQQLLPQPPGELPKQWTHADEVVGVLFRLDHVSANHLRSAPLKQAERLVVVKLEGDVAGRVDGAKTTIRVSGEYWLDRSSGHIVWLACNIHEDREPGHTAPGMRVAANVKIKREPMEEPATWGGQSWSNIGQQIQQAQNADLQLELVSERHGLRVLHDARWYHVLERSDGIILRLLDDGELVAQCHLNGLADLPPGKQTSLEEFQQDIRKVLDQQFGEFAQAEELTRPDGCRLFHVVVRGTASDVPVRWIYYHLANTAGRRATCVFTLAEEAESRFAGLDRQFVESVQFVPKAEATAAMPARSAGK